MILAARYFCKGRFTAIETEDEQIKANSTGRNYIEHLINSLNNSVKLSAKFDTRVREVMDMKYTPSSVGMAKEFTML